LNEEEKKRLDKLVDDAEEKDRRFLRMLKERTARAMEDSFSPPSPPDPVYPGILMKMQEFDRNHWRNMAKLDEAIKLVDLLRRSKLVIKDGELYHQIHVKIKDIVASLDL
jgi:hypothetical protein